MSSVFSHAGVAEASAVFRRRGLSSAPQYLHGVILIEMHHGRLCAWAVLHRLVHTGGEL
jgi:hypothetical protein